MTMPEHDDKNNEIYRRVKTAFEFTDDDLVELWNDAGEFFSPSTVNAFARSSDNRRYKPLYSGPLKKLLKALCDRVSVEAKGFSISAYITALCIKYGVTPTGDPLKDAQSLRESLRD